MVFKSIVRVCFAIIVGICLNFGQANALSHDGISPTENNSGRIIGNCYGRLGIPFSFPFSGAVIHTQPPGNGGVGMIAGGRYFTSSGSLIGAGGNSLPPEVFLQTICGLTEIQNLVEDGPNGTFASDDFVGWSFTARDPSDSIVYNYVVALEGVANTQLTISKTLPPSDTTRPTPNITGNPAEYVGVTPFSVTVEFDENVSGFGDQPTDVEVTNGSLTNIIKNSDDNYTLEITPGGTGEVSIRIPENAAQDGAMNGSLASLPKAVAQADITSPSVVISDAPDSFTNTTPFTLTVTFSEDVFGFDDVVADLTVTNATVTDIDGGPAAYTVEITLTCPPKSGPF